jgi:hypothetical protein
MTQEDYRHPIAPPPELVQQWFHEAQRNGDPDVLCWMQATAAKAAQWGADQELEACCALLQQKGVPAWSLLRMHRRPKPQSLKEDALRGLNGLAGRLEEAGLPADLTVIRQALEQLPDAQ